MADIPPFWSLHWEELSKDELAAFGEAYYAARAMLGSGRAAEALMELEKAAAISPGFADARYLLAKALEDLGRRAEALPHYRAAKEKDASNERALDRPNAILRQVAKKHGAHILDTEAALAPLDPDGILGSVQFFDLQHPNGKALAALARAIAEEIWRLTKSKNAAGSS